MGFSLSPLLFCSWELWVYLGPALLSSRHRWILALLVHMLFHLVKQSVRHRKDFWLPSFIGPLLLTLQKGIYYRTKPHEFNSAPALLIFRLAHSIILLYCWLSSVSIRDLLGDRRLIFIVFSQRVQSVSLCPDFCLSTRDKLMIWIHFWLNWSTTLLLCGQNTRHSLGERHVL